MGERLGEGGESCGWGRAVSGGGGVIGGCVCDAAGREHARVGGVGGGDDERVRGVGGGEGEGTWSVGGGERERT